MDDQILSSLFGQEEVEVLTEDQVKVVPDHQLILHNDEVNTFDWVIESLEDICGHDVIQAEQLTLLIHYKGKAGCKSGSIKQLRPMKDSFIDRGIQATIEDI